VSYLNREGPEGTYRALLASNPATPAPATSVAHLAATVATELSHVNSHLGHAVTDTSPEAMAFDVKHAHHHAGVAAEHHDRLLSHLSDRDPEVGAELAALKAATPGDDSFTPPEGAEEP
jgi:hypothetical protein